MYIYRLYWSIRSYRNLYRDQMQEFRLFKLPPLVMSDGVGMAGPLLSAGLIYNILMTKSFVMLGDTDLLPPIRKTSESQ
jgi:hypothetical protein